jgi:ABC-2 type transport system permease protein
MGRWGLDATLWGGGPVKLGRYLRLASILAGASVAVRLEYRANFVANLVESLLRAATVVLGLAVLYGDGLGVGGWSYAEATVLIGVFTIIESLMGMTMYPNLRRIAEAVRTGSMDFVLLKPVDGQFLVSAREIDVFRLPDLLIGLGFAIYGMLNVTTVTLTGILTGMLLMVGSLGIAYALCFMLATLAFWFVRVENTLELFWGLYRAGQFPITAYPGWVRQLFTFVVPVAFMTTVPAQAIIGKPDWGGALGTLLFATGLLAVSRAFWKFALRSYTSASS